MARWIKIYDGLLDWGWHTRPEMVSLFVHLLLKANVKDSHFEGVEVKRGQLVTSRKELSILTGISEQSIRTCINHLKNTGEIAIKSTKRFSIITICKYDSYQAKKESANQPTNQQPTNNQPTPNQRLTTSIEYKKEEYKREDINKPSSSLSSSPWADLTPAEQKEEKFLFFEIFFFKNYNQLNEEVDRFVAANNSTLWTRGNGKPYATRATCSAGRALEAETGAGSENPYQRVPHRLEKMLRALQVREPRHREILPQLPDNMRDQQDGRP